MAVVTVAGGISRMKFGELLGAQPRRGKRVDAVGEHGLRNAENEEVERVLPGDENDRSFTYLAEPSSRFYPLAGSAEINSINTSLVGWLQPGQSRSCHLISQSTRSGEETYCQRLQLIARGWSQRLAFTRRVLYNPLDAISWG